MAGVSTNALSSITVFFIVSPSRQGVLLMTPAAIFLILHIKGFLTVMAFTAEIALTELRHIHLVGSLLHLKNCIMAAGAFETFFVDMFFMAEYNRAGILWIENYVSTSDFLTNGNSRSAQAERNNYQQNFNFHSFPSPERIKTKLL